MLNDDYRWLIGAEAAAILKEFADVEPASTGAVNRLRKRLPVERARLVLDQVSLRRRGAAKFSRAAEMFFTSVGLEQATDEALARYKAVRFPAGQPIADLCCGVGGDLMALAARGIATGIDRDPVACMFAAENCRVCGSTSSVRAATVTGDPRDIVGFAAWHIDPDRRATGRRTTRVEAFAPPLVGIERLVAANPQAAIKLAPATRAPEAWRRDAELEWLGRNRECRQQVAWFGKLAEHPGHRRATIVDRDGRSLRTVVGLANPSRPDMGAIGRFLFEPDAAIYAAGLTGALAAELRLTALATDNTYLSGDKAIADPALAAFEVIEVMPYRPKRIKQLLKARGIGRLEVKKRGVPLDPEAARRELSVPGEDSAVLLVTRVGRVVTALLARRLRED